MFRKLFYLLIIFSFCVTESYSQENDLNKKTHIEFNSKTYSNIELKEKILSSKNENSGIEINQNTAKSKKSPGLALLFSLVLPGAGHYYLDRMDVGKYFLGADAAGWLGLVSMNIYGDAIRDDSRSYSSTHAAINDPNNKDDEFYKNIGSFNNVYEYNNDKLTRGEYSLLYNTQQNFWNWDNTDNRNFYESQRKKSERVYNNRIIFSSILIANRIVSGISAFFIANNTGKSSAALNISPELLYKEDLTFDGVKLNFNRDF
ncbi:MAG TPA: hypothetical protein PK536_12135 [Ignavibacteria bacterium]|nr:hypothetical protein [Ignavibacteria bacterium]HRK00633.1 hypothetical protein [Ignavibacteria bacterium]